jgi:hypothetical protein
MKDASFKYPFRLVSLFQEAGCHFLFLDEKKVTPFDKLRAGSEKSRTGTKQPVPVIIT